jgi:hypothetical protein
MVLLHDSIGRILSKLGLVEACKGVAGDRI